MAPPPLQLWKDEKGVVKPLQRVAPADRAAARKALRHMVCALSGGTRASGLLSFAWRAHVGLEPPFLLPKRCTLLPTCRSPTFSTQPPPLPAQTNKLLPALPKRLVPDYAVRRLQEQRERKAAEKKCIDEYEAEVRRAAAARLKAKEEAQRAAQAKAAQAAGLKAAAKCKREVAAAAARAAREYKAAAGAGSKARAARAAARAGRRS